MLLEHPDVETRIMEKLRDLRVCEELLQIGRRIGVGRKLHRMTHAVARRQLHQAQAVANRVEPECLAVDSDQWSEFDRCRQVTLVKLDLHAFRSPLAFLRRNDTASSTEA